MNKQELHKWLNRAKSHETKCFECDDVLVEKEYGWIGRDEVFCSKECRKDYREYLDNVVRREKGGSHERRDCR